MRLYEFYLKEDTSLSASIKNIIDIIKTQLPLLYDQMKNMASTYAENHGGLDKGFNFIAGGRKAHWFQTVFFPSLKPRLYNLSRHIPKHLNSEMQNLLSTIINDPKLYAIENTLPELLDKIAREIKNKDLLGAALTFKHLLDDYHSHLQKFKDHPEDDYEEIPISPKDTTISKQNQSVDKVINDILSRIDKKHAGEIRNAIAKSANKLQTLQAELAKRNIKP